MYANDRASASDEMHAFLDSGGILVLDRYATSNMGHQGSKFKNLKERDEFIEWNYEMEYQINNLPQEDIVLFLHMPWETAYSLRSKADSKEYLQGKDKDIHEENKEHLKEAEQTYMYLAEKYNHWAKITCIENDTLLSIKDIHLKIIETLKSKQII